MRLFRPLVLSLSLLGSFVRAEDDFDLTGVKKEKHNYQSDVARLRKIVINSLYSHNDIFLRELISNANDALEKLRITSLTEKGLWDGEHPLNITIKVVKNEFGTGGRIVITDTGIGMSPEELSTNLGTLAKSGTSDFLAKAEGNTDGTNQGNLIGAFGLGFYSSFLVADKVYVASVPPKSKKHPNPVQHVFSSSAEDSAFEIFPDPRGNTLGFGTEITLFLKDDASEYLDTTRLTDLINKHSVFSSGFPIYLLTQKTEMVPDPDEIPATSETASESSAAAESTSSPEIKDEDEAIVEDVTSDEKKTEEAPPPKMKSVTVDEWVRVNGQPPLWTRDPKNVTNDEYESFYSAFFKDYTKPSGWQHFSGDSGEGVSFKALIYLPPKIEDNFWQEALNHRGQDVKLMVKRTFITNDFGVHSLPKWASWLKGVVDADDLPLNVNRETLQANSFVKQLKSVLVKRLVQLLTRISEEEEDKYKELLATYGTVIKLGAVEDVKNRDKLINLVRFSTNQRNFTTLDKYLENKKKGQKQIFYINELGKDPQEIAKSVFVEKLHARGYEVLLLNEPIDEIFVGNIRQWKGFQFQDVAKVGLKFGDEDQDEEEEKAEQKELTEKFQPLIDYLKKQAEEVVRDVIISSRLVSSPCAVVADTYGYTANVQKMMNAQSKKTGKEYLHEIQRKAKLLEINPRSPLIEGMLRRVEQLPTEEGEKDPEAEAELKEVASILIDGALIRSGFDVPNTNDFFSRVDRVLRRSLGVSETAPTDTTVKPAPPVDPEIPPEPENDPTGDLPFQLPDDETPGVKLPDSLKDQVKIEMEEIDEHGNVVVPPTHDEL